MHINTINKLTKELRRLMIGYIRTEDTSILVQIRNINWLLNSGVDPKTPTKESDGNE